MKTLSQIRDEVYTLMHLNDKDKRNYDKAIIQAVNYAVVELSQEVSPIIDRMTVMIMENKNLLQKEKRKFSLHSEEVKNMNFDKVGSIAFRYMGEGEMKVFRNGEHKLYSLDDAFTPEEFILTFEQADYAKFTFQTDSRLMIFDLGIYSGTENVTFGMDHVEYDMDKLTDGRFMKFYSPCPVIDLETDEIPEGVRFKDDHTLCLKNRDGSYEISFLRYPTLLPSGAGGNEIVDVSREAAELIPLLCAWRLLKEDDERLATMYYNEYISAKENIIMLNAVNSIPDINIGGGVL